MQNLRSSFGFCGGTPLLRSSSFRNSGPSSTLALAEGWSSSALAAAVEEYAVVTGGGGGGVGGDESTIELLCLLSASLLFY
ncbi:hypothetical protein KSP40_PGU007719 [Platanthera guangdongensis]|uniref:Uncharacterized protein n=1 Tax=Platanthera guangdongensis TaxID=2320717 RepID=A0ABR2LR13_9ASPA